MASKRRCDSHPDDSETIPKKAMHQDYFSALPTELLEEIFGYLTKEDCCIKNLTETCTRFEGILSPRLGLALDFDRIKREGYPTIRGNYTIISMFGSEIEKKHKSVLQMLESSKSVEKKKVIIGKLGKTTKIKLQTLLLLLGMPSIEYLTLIELEVSAPRLAIPDRRFPELPHLKHLHLQQNTGPVLSAFKKVTDLRSLLIGTPEDIEQMGSFISAQKQLLLLLTEPLIKLKAGTLPELHTFILDDSSRTFDDEVFNFAPNLQEVLLLRTCSSCCASLIYFNSSPTIKSIRFLMAELPPGFDLDDIISNYPSLTSIDSVDYQWRKN